MKNNKLINKASFFVVILSVMLITPTMVAITNQRENQINNLISEDYEGDISKAFDITKTIDKARYNPIEEVSLVGYQNDIGYNSDAGPQFRRANPIYIGEPINQNIPGRGRNGKLDPNDRDEEDWYEFSLCEGQSVQASLSSSEDFDFEFTDTAANPVGKGYTAIETGLHYLHIFANDGANTGDYIITITAGGQNDAGSGGDAGNNIGDTTSISSGEYFGYLDSNDWEDWYSFIVNSGEGIFIDLEAYEKSDFDIHLYNPNDELVHSEQFYGEDSLEFPADISGTWKIKIDIFPGWDTSKWPDDYLLYGSGAYDLELSIGGGAEAPPVLKPQPVINPVAQTFIINDDPNSNKDEYSYLAAIPAANYIENGQRYVSPILYQGVDIIPNWFTTIDQTTQYLIDDWNEYLSRHEIVATEYTLSNDPIQAAANIATTKWSIIDTAVIAVDGSTFTDETQDILNQDASLNCIKETSSFQPEDLRELTPGVYSAPMYLGSQWGLIHVIANGNGFTGDTLVQTPRYEALMGDWWPHDDDAPGGDEDTVFPIIMPGLWAPQVTSINGLDEMIVTKYSGNRHNIRVSDSDTSLEVKITTDEDSHLVVFLIDPEDNIRRPSMPHWNGGEIKPLYQWNGGHWEHDEKEYRHWVVEPHKEFSVEIHNPMVGTWTTVVVPYLDHDTWEASFNGNYHITASLRSHNPDRISAGLSASNAAVLASLKHVPLLYVTRDDVPTSTSNAIEQLGINNIIFVNINDLSSASPSGNVIEYNTMQDIIDAIKEHPESENYITMTSFATGDGYFAPSGMIAAYHGSPVLDFGELKASYNVLDMYQTWREYDGDYYHGCRSLGHITMMDEPSEMENPPSLLDLIIYYITHEQELPPVGLDLKLHWVSIINNGIYDMVDGYGLDNDGQEIYLFVSPRDTDIRDPISRVLMGNNSYAGQIPVETTAFSTAMICRNMLYPAVIYANPGRDVTTSQHMNYYAGVFDHVGNNGFRYVTDGPRDNKNSYSSHGRFYEGHCMWDNLLERYNEGVSLTFYSGHGTGGSGISSQYKNIAQQYPLGEPRYENLYDFEWWDSWAGYAGYDDSTTKTVRDHVNSIYNAEEPSLYNIIHFKWVDQLFENLHSEIDIWSSCTTASHFGPMVYLTHGTVVYAGCLGSGYTLVDDLYKSWILRDLLIKGYSIGEAFSTSNWIINRDYTTNDPSSIYGGATFFADGISSNNCIFGDPTLQIYNPTWIEPIPTEP